MKFIKLTYFKPQKNYGPSGGGKTQKKFYLAIDHIIRITEYAESTKISLSTDCDIEVCETIHEVAEKIKNASPLYTELNLPEIKSKNLI